ncbi:MAG: nucleoside diphosphate kinase regulator [Bacteroidales bacterium]|jgi:regulator of nucleoside diphosphate kinase|nr:nucleoside diphosphate kinase regulator [Bacteroidales bacterium]NCU35405.1 nucleoside diphosphate kinase regulator [Candidatus Falkowbacteria bacterium]MDD2631748.1 nucleoside diphosphate kinase regulator [Bacteroidales bacterium]MDD3525421.1 nucleoside diphosphate kinase regulator [Bacteroidales bacterium]MDD4177736.1 nucleoside diphosphate kinase regulator [Bacteroidales bacterium]
MKGLIVNRLDYGRIKKYIEQARQLRSINAAESEKLLEELENAQVREPQDIPSDVVTMNSIVKVSFLNTKKEVQFQLVYPDQANFKEQKISIFSPIATALIGYKVGDEVEWVVPGGLTKLKIEQIVYQPEAAGDYQL